MARIRSHLRKTKSGKLSQVQSFQRGDRVSHPKHGMGEVTHVGPDSMSVSWDNPVQAMLGPRPHKKEERLKKIEPYWPGSKLGVTSSKGVRREETSIMGRFPDAKTLDVIRAVHGDRNSFRHTPGNPGAFPTGSAKTTADEGKLAVQPVMGVSGRNGYGTSPVATSGTVGNDSADMGASKGRG